MKSPPRVFTIPAGTPFLPELCDAFRSGALFGRVPLTPEEMASARIFVPTRRAGAALTSALASATGASATLLPRIVPLGDLDAIEDALSGEFGLDSAESLPEIGDLDRRLMLFTMVDQWRAAIATIRDDNGESEPFHVGASRADAFALAGDLARLIDETIIEDVPLARLAKGIPEVYRPEHHSGYWDLTERFLTIAAAHYPAWLAEAGVADSVTRLKQRIRAFTDWIAKTQPASPIVIAGSTGSVAATAELMAAVARLPMGAVVLPGLDSDVLDADAWDGIGDERADLPTRYGHPQGLLKRTLQRIGIDRDGVTRLPAGSHPSPRETVLAEMFRPAATTNRWAAARMPGSDLDAAIGGISLIRATDEREEALTVALLFREVLNTPGKTAALVTPDRSIARAVQSELQRWNVSVADSAGEPLASTPAATLARLVLDASVADAGAPDVLALLRHPLVRLGLDDGERRAALEAIEIAGLRGKRLRGGIAGLPDAMRRAIAEIPDHRQPAPRRRITPETLALGLAHAERMAQAFAPLTTMIAARPTLRALAAAHRRTVETLLQPSPEEAGCFAGDDGRAVAILFDEIDATESDGPTLDLADYSRMFDELLAGRVVRPRQPGHPRLKIWGLLEARLLDADRVILAGLDEGIWPPEMRGDPFLNRPMRIALGLQPPERRLGQTAHDFMMLLGAPEVVLTHAQKRGGSPAIPSRFLRRLDAFIGTDATKAMAARGEPVLRWARALDQPQTVRPVAQPAPRPPADLTPERISLTEVETLYRDPYAVFARRILGLDPLDPLDPPLDARDRGNIVHQALSEFTGKYAKTLPADAADQLLRFGREAFAEIEAEDPEAVRFWWQRFQAFVPWFVGWDAARRGKITTLHSEIRGALDLSLPAGRVTRLSTRADRIEILDDGSLAIIDYKTGSPPGKNEVLRGLAPQLPLTAALVARGAFSDLGHRDLDQGVAMSYLHVAGSRGEGDERVITPKKPTPADATPPEALVDTIERQFAQLQGYLGQHVIGVLGYQSHRIPKKANYTGPYDHLARHLEWSLGGEEEGEA